MSKNDKRGFRVGDRVRCVSPSNTFPGLVEGAVYQVAGTGDLALAPTVCVHGVESPISEGWFADRFVAIHETPEDHPTSMTVSPDVDVPRYQQDAAEPADWPWGPYVSTGTARSPVADPVFRPNHYARYAIEPITFIQANDLPFDIGNVVKYALRYDAKDGIQDLMKARRYLDIRIETLARKARIESGEMPRDVWKVAL